MKADEHLMLLGSAFQKQHTSIQGRKFPTRQNVINYDLPHLGSYIINFNLIANASTHNYEQNGTSKYPI